MRAVAVAVVVACVALLSLTLTAQAPTARTVWSGVYSDTQAARGQSEYAAHCAGCHLDDLSGYQSILKGERFMSEFREASLYRLFDKIKTTMPRNAAGTLTDSAYVDIVSYVLKSNNFPAGADELTANDLQRVQVVRETGPEPAPNFSLVQVVGCLGRSQTEGGWLLTSATEQVRSLHPRKPDQRHEHRHGGVQLR